MRVIRVGKEERAVKTLSSGYYIFPSRLSINTELDDTDTGANATQHQDSDRENYEMSFQVGLCSWLECQ